MMTQKGSVLCNNVMVLHSDKNLYLGKQKSERNKKEGRDFKNKSTKFEE
jgi:hypothetical protein